MAGRERGLQAVGPERAARLRSRQRRQAAPDQQAIPAATILRHQQYRLPLRIDARRQA